MMRTKKGFTLIELLVVVSLIGVLATLVLANLNAARKRGRDAQRKSDLRNIQTALRIYYNDYDRYPASDAGRIAGCGLGTTPCDWGVEAFATDMQTYMSTLPSDPLPNMNYVYIQGADLDDYVLMACLENKSDDAGQTATSGECESQWKYEVSP